MKVAVTGAAGQLGTVVLRRLAVERGVTAVRALDLRPPAVASAKLTHVRADVRDPDFARHLDGCDALVHLAFLVTGHPPRALFDAVNVGGSRNVLTAALRAGVRQIVYSSSIAAYGVVHGHPVPIVESTPRVYQRDFAYAAAKHEVEAFLDELERAHPDVAMARLRPGVLLGAPTAHGLGAVLSRRLAFDLPAPPPLVWDEDVADAVALALRKQARGAFNLVAEPATPARALAKACGLTLLPLPRFLTAAAAPLAALAARLGLPDAIDPAWLRVGEVTMIVSSERARAELGWAPRCKTPLEVVQRFLRENPSGLDRRLDLFFRLVQLAARRPPPEGARMTGRIHLRLTGPGGGDIGLVLDGRRLHVLREIPRPPTATLTMRATTFADLLAGRTEFTTAQLTGKVRVEGDALAALVPQAIIATFRQRAPRRLQRLVCKGATA